MTGLVAGLDIAGALVTLVIIVALLYEKKAGLVESKYLRWILYAVLGMTATNIPIRVCYGDAQSMGILKIMICLNMLFAFLYCFFFELYLVYNLRKKVYISDNLMYYTAFVTFSLAGIWILGFFQKPTWFVSFYLADGTFEYKNSFILPLFFFAVLSLFSIGLVMSCYKVISSKTMVAWLTACCAPILFTFIIYAYSGIIMAFGFTLSSFILYSNIHVNRLREATATERNLIESKSKLLISQIQPHFMYNSLNSIYYLIGKDPDKAKDALSTFSDYLRKNVNSLKNDKPVPFYEELEHVSAYLYLEQMRFGNKIKTSFDIKENEFLIPPLSVQPMVENAVKHGLSQKAQGGNVWISTYKDDTNYYVEIKDDGVGFDKDKPNSDGDTHVGISNVGSRLESMCKGRLEIDSNPGQGTTCKIILPIDAQNVQKDMLL